MIFFECKHIHCTLGAEKCDASISRIRNTYIKKDFFIKVYIRINISYAPLSPSKISGQALPKTRVNSEKYSIFFCPKKRKVTLINLCFDCVSLFLRRYCYTLAFAFAYSVFSSRIYIYIWGGIIYAAITFVYAKFSHC